MSPSQRSEVIDEAVYPVSELKYMAYGHTCLSVRYRLNSTDPGIDDIHSNHLPLNVVYMYLLLGGWHDSALLSLTP